MNHSHSNPGGPAAWVWSTPPGTPPGTFVTTTPAAGLLFQPVHWSRRRGVDVSLAQRGAAAASPRKMPPPPRSGCRQKGMSSSGFASSPFAAWTFWAFVLAAGFLAAVEGAAGFACGSPSIGFTPLT